MAMDVYEHAYFMDFGSARAGYIDAFLQNMDWGKVEENFDDVKGGGCCCCGNCSC